MNKLMFRMKAVIKQKLMKEKTFETMLGSVFIVVFVATVLGFGWFTYKYIVKPTVKAAVQFLNVDNATPQAAPSKSKSRK